jgi:hypothetical protein
MLSGDLQLLFSCLLSISCHSSTLRPPFLACLPLVVLLDASPEADGDSVPELEGLNEVSVILLALKLSAMIKMSDIHTFKRSHERYLLLLCSEGLDLNQLRVN